MQHIGSLLGGRMESWAQEKGESVQHVLQTLSNNLSQKLRKRNTEGFRRGIRLTRTESTAQKYDCAIFITTEQN